MARNGQRPERSPTSRRLAGTPFRRRCACSGPKPNIDRRSHGPTTFSALSSSNDDRMRLPPATAPILRSALRSQGANGHAAFVPQIRKLVFEYCDVRISSGPLREYLLKDVEALAARNPHVEIVVKQRPQRQPIVRGFYSEFAVVATGFPIFTSLDSERS